MVNQIRHAAFLVSWTPWSDIIYCIMYWPGPGQRWLWSVSEVYVWVWHYVGGCPVCLTCAGCWLCSCVNPGLCFCPPNWWGRKTGSWPSCTLKSEGKEAVRSTQCCHCLQRCQCPLIYNKGKHPVICVITGMNLHTADITLGLLM